MNIENVIQLIKEYHSNNGIVPTISIFSSTYKFHASSLIREFGSWNELLNKAGLKPNKSKKRSDDQLLKWLKAHPNIKYSDIPTGIRGGIEEKFGSIINARKMVGLPTSDWRSCIKHKKCNPNGGRPIEYSKELIINGLRNLALSLGRPPRLKDIKKSTCGFPVSAILSRFHSFNKALIEATLPPVYSYQEFNKLENELEKLLINIKICLNEIPKYYNVTIDNCFFPKFIYEDKWEDVKLTRNEINISINTLLKYKEKCDKLIVYYLVDDSLYENENINMICIMDYVNIIKDPLIVNKIIELRMKYDEINRKYIGQPLLINR